MPGVETGRMVALGDWGVTRDEGARHLGGTCQAGGGVQLRYVLTFGGVALGPTGNGDFALDVAGAGFVEGEHRLILLPVARCSAPPDLWMTYGSLRISGVVFGVNILLLERDGLFKGTGILEGGGVGSGCFWGTCGGWVGAGASVCTETDIIFGVGTGSLKNRSMVGRT